MLHLKMSASIAVILYTPASANLMTQILYMTNALTIRKCDNCGYIIDCAEQPWTYMRERLRTAYYHYDAVGCQESTDKKKGKHVRKK